MVTPLPLEPPVAARRQLAAAAAALIERWLARRDEAPIFTPPDAATVAALLAPPPEPGREVEAVLAQLQAAAAGGWNKRHGGDLAFIPSGGLYSGAIAAWLASALQAFTATAFEAPALVALEESVLRWWAGVLGLPPVSEGLLLSGGSLANQTAIVCARELAGFAAGGCTVYLSERAHHSLPKALHLCGIAATAVRSIAVDGQGRLDIAALRRRIADDHGAGGRPGLVIGTAGSTDLGAIDDLEALAAIAAEAGAWFHVDAAYGGCFALTARGRERLRGLEAADSVTLDMHKGLMLPYGVAALLVRRPGALAAAHQGRGDYLRDVPEWPGLPNYFERGPELTRPFRGLQVWLPLQLHGVAAFRNELDRQLDLAAQAAAALRRLPAVELLHEPMLSIVAFRCRGGDGATTHWLEVLNRSGRFHVSSTQVEGRIAIRLALLQPLTTPALLDELVAAISSMPSSPAPP